jgi:hypothetical protein
VRAVIERSKISLESYKKIQIMKLTVITKEHTGQALFDNADRKL